MPPFEIEADSAAGWLGEDLVGEDGLPFGGEDFDGSRVDDHVELDGLRQGRGRKAGRVAAGEVGAEARGAGLGAVDEDGARATIDADQGFLAGTAAHLEAELVGVPGFEFADDLESQALNSAIAQVCLSGGNGAGVDGSRSAPDCFQRCDRGLNDAQPSSVLRSATDRGIVMAPRQGEVGISLAYCQLFIQASQIGRPAGASFQV